MTHLTLEFIARTNHASIKVGTSGAILIDSLERFLFQQRDNKPEILYPSMIGLFGGHREGNETFLECVVREIYEEISYFLPSERFTHLTSYTGAHPLGGTIYSEIYVANNVPVDYRRNAFVG